MQKSWRWKWPLLAFAAGLLTFLLVIPFLPRPSASTRKQDGPHASIASTTLPFEFIDNRVFVEVTLNARGPFHFILDTGAGGALVDDDVAQQLSLKIEDAGEQAGVGNTKVRVGRTQIARVEIGSLRFDNLEFAVMSRADTPNVFGTKPMDGVIGLPVFERFVVKHDYANKRLTFTPSDEFAYSGQGAVISFTRPRQIPVVEADLDGVHGRFGVDTGARSSLLLYGPFSESNHLKEKYNARLEGVTGWGIGGPVRSLLARAKGLKIGEVSVHNLVIRLSTQKAGLTTSSDLAGLIGPDVLSQFDVTFDYARNHIIFEKNANYGRPDSYDRAGLWMGQSGRNFTVIDVIPGGPAYEAGIREGETILAIDGESTERLVLPDVREEIRRTPPGNKLTLLLESDGKQRNAVITLRDLV